MLPEPTMATAVPWHIVIIKGLRQATGKVAPPSQHVSFATTAVPNISDTPTPTPTWPGPGSLLPNQPMHAVSTLSKSLLNQKINTKQFAKHENQKEQVAGAGPPRPRSPYLPGTAQGSALGKESKPLFQGQVPPGRGHSEPAPSVGPKEEAGAGPGGSGAAGGWQKSPRIPEAAGACGRSS